MVDQTSTRKSSDHVDSIDNQLGAAINIFLKEVNENYDKECKQQMKSTFGTLVSREHVVVEFGNETDSHKFQGHHEEKMSKLLMMDFPPLLVQVVGSKMMKARKMKIFNTCYKTHDIS
jgi:hypothetical protein